MVHFYASKYIFRYKGTLKTQYGLVHKFARYKQFYKHMIILKNVNNCDITYKTDSHFFFFFLNNTSFVGMKAVVSSSFSDDIPDKQRPTIWFFYWLGVRAFEIWTKKEKQPLGIKAKTSEIKMVWREEHKIQDQKSRRDPLNSDPLAVNSCQSTNGWLPGLPGAGKVQWWFLYFKKLGTMFWIVQYQSKN